ncbi:hypothetical protein CKAH01_07325 [Colletotrichum kahawae]|uniref:Uncharacterized protein n=1 Tax=Colletotrichum kahawae TaxID=34407 RepID=A0AAD9Y715_COLKA|nr:hypothetical protein CKAH01_07325 [Colletotrichum kahawae]
MTRQLHLQRELADNEWETTRALATGSLALYNKNISSADVFKMARRLGPKVRRSGAQSKVMACICRYFRSTADDECCRHLRHQSYAVFWPG